METVSSFAPDFTTIVVIAFVIFLIISAKMAIKTVPQGFQALKEQFTKYKSTLEPGLNIIIPYIQTIQIVNIKEQVLDVPSQDVFTKDNVSMSVNGVAYFQIMDARKATYKVNNLKLALTTLCLTNIRSVLGDMELDQALSQRDHINTRLVEIVDAATEAWGVKVTRVEIKELDPPRDISEAMARQMKAERDKRAQILDAEGTKQAAITTAEGERQSAILSAEGEKQAAILEADGRKEAAFRDAEARERLAAAEAKATEVVSKAIEEGDKDAINYFVAQKYTEALGQIASGKNTRVVAFPMELSGIASAVSGVGALLEGNKNDTEQKASA